MSTTMSSSASGWISSGASTPRTAASSSDSKSIQTFAAPDFAVATASAGPTRRRRLLPPVAAHGSRPERQRDATGAQVDAERVLELPRVAPAERDDRRNAAAGAAFEHPAVARLEPRVGEREPPELVALKRVRAGLIEHDL